MKVEIIKINIQYYKKEIRQDNAIFAKKNFFWNIRIDLDAPFCSSVLKILDNLSACKKTA